MKNIVEFPFCLEEKVAVVSCVGPTWKDVKIKQGKVKELTVSILDSKSTISITVEFDDNTRYSCSLFNSANIAQVFSPDNLTEIVKQLEKAGYNIR